MHTETGLIMLLHKEEVQMLYTHMKVHDMANKIMLKLYRCCHTIFNLSRSFCFSFSLKEAQSIHVW